MMEEIQQRTSARTTTATSTIGTDANATSRHAEKGGDEGVAGVQADEFQRVHICRCLAELKQRMLDAGLAPTKVNGAKAADMLPMQRVGHESDIQRWRVGPSVSFYANAYMNLIRR